jgi:hypothetical protein
MMEPLSPWQWRLLQALFALSTLVLVVWWVLSSCWMCGVWPF